MSKSTKIKADIQSAQTKRDEIAAIVASTGNPDVKKALEVNLATVDAEILKLQADLVKAEQYDSLHNKDWNALFEKYPALKSEYDSTMAIGARVNYQTIQSKIALKAAEDNAIGMIVEGKSGTGKTTFFRYLGKQLNRAVITVNGSSGMTEEELLGKWAKNEEGEPVFNEGPLLLAMRTGSILAIEEINATKPAVSMILNSLLDDLRQVKHPLSSESIRPEAGFMLCGTLNNGYAGTRKMNKALINRFPVAFQMNDMSKSAFTEIMRQKLSDITDEELKISWYVFKSITNIIEREEYDAVISIRQAIQLVKTKRYDSTYSDGRPKHSWRAAIDMAVKSQVTGFEDDMVHEIDKVSEAVYTHIDKKTGVFNDAAVPMFDPVANGGAQGTDVNGIQSVDDEGSVYISKDGGR